MQINTLLTMHKQNFDLRPNEDFIPLDKLLKITRLVGSGGEAHAVIQQSKVKVNGETELQKRKKIRRGDVVQFNNNIIHITE